MILRQSGYYTGFIGKWGVGDSRKNKREGGGKSITGKEVMKLLASKFDYWYAWTGQGHYIHKLSNGKTIHLTHIVNNKAKQFLSNTPDNQPFCLSISFKAPHVQDGKKARIPEPELMDLYKDVTIPKPKTDKPKYFNMLPEFLQKTENRTRWVQYFHHYKGHKHSYQKSMKDYYRLITGVDRVIGNIRKQLKEMGAADNTIIMFMGDNGLFEGKHGLSGKWYGYRSSVRVPMIIYDPLVPDSARGQRRDNMALNIDIAPTILDLAGIDIPKQMQGRSLVPLLKGEHPQWRNDFLYEHLWNTPNWAIPMSQGVISKRYTYLQYLDSNYKIFYEHLFDKKKDPHEIDNLARDPKYFNILEMLRNRMHGLIEARK
jgi:arylsulfatase A-like enzyme